MKREAVVFALLVFLGIPVVSLAQTGDPSPAPSAEVLGPTLVAWSQMQKPKPVPQPLPPPDRPDQQPETPDAQQPAPSAEPATSDQPSPSSAQTFTGTIVKDSGRFVLKVSKDHAYQLDDQERASQYEGKQVKVAGRLDKGTNTLHVVSVELVS